MQQKKQELESKIEELESAISDLKTRLHEVEIDEQHKAIENMDDLFGALDHKWDSLRDFWPVALEEIKEFFGRFQTQKKE
jgi:predicted nuclease with TOPRIM domain